MLYGFSGSLAAIHFEPPNVTRPLFGASFSFNKCIADAESYSDPSGAGALIYQWVTIIHASTPSVALSPRLSSEGAYYTDNLNTVNSFQR